MEIKVKGLRHRFGNTYSVIGNFVLRVDHAAVRESRFAEQMLLPFFPPLFVRLMKRAGIHSDKSASVSAFGGS